MWKTRDYSAVEFIDKPWSRFYFLVLVTDQYVITEEEFNFKTKVARHNIRQFQVDPQDNELSGHVQNVNSHYQFSYILFNINSENFVLHHDNCSS